MHFNDLIIRLRTQALAGVAAISAVVGLFAKSQDLKLDWQMAMAVFFMLCLFWIAIWIIDFCYYNRLLAGAVAALLDIETRSAHETLVTRITLSTIIEDTVAGLLPKERANPKIMRGPLWFYSIVLFALLVGFGYSIYEFSQSPPAPQDNSYRTPHHVI